MEIARGHKIIKTLRRLPLIQSVLLKDLIYGLEILFEDGFASLNHMVLICRYGDGYQNQHDADDDHQLKHGEAREARMSPSLSRLVCDPQHSCGAELGAKALFRKARFARPRSASLPLLYQSLYLVPSSAVFSDLL